MYNLLGMRPHNQAFWQALATLLGEAGVSDIPQLLDHARPPVPPEIGQDVLFTQTCGYPLQNLYRGQFAVLGVPEYIAPGCGDPALAGPTHRAFFLVRTDHPARNLADLRGCVFACNSLRSNSGFNLPRRTVAQLAAGHVFFSRIVLTGSHPSSMAFVRSGRADACTVDNLTHAFHADHHPEALAGLRVLGQTVSSPAIPFITAASTDAATSAALRQALQRLSAEASFAGVRQALRIRAIHPPEAADYTVLLRYEAEARALLHPTLGLAEQTVSGTDNFHGRVRV